MSDGAEERGGMERRPDAESEQGSALRELVDGAPGLIRIAADTGWRGARALAGAYRRAGTRLLRGPAEPEPEPARPVARHGEDFSTEALRRRGAELLRQSADVRVEQDSHPAYMRILDVLAPDEARILRFLARSGPQPSVDVRAGLPLASELVAQGQTMIAEEAGCRYQDRVYAYLNNLHRLGLIWFSREPLRDSERYLVLEAQPEVTQALEEGGRTARTVRRSIVLTPFGTDFCEICLPLGGDDEDGREASRQLRRPGPDPPPYSP
jgi:hypothetical protein